MRVGELDGRIQPVQVVAVRPGDLRLLQRVENRLVVLVDQDDRALPRAFAQRRDEMAEALRCGGVVRTDACRPFDAGQLFDGAQLRHQVRVQVVRLGEVAAAEVEAQHGMAQRPVPAVVDVQPDEQRLVPLEQLLHRVEEQALAEAARSRQEVVLTLVHEAADEPGLVDVVAVVLADLAKFWMPVGSLRLGCSRVADMIAVSSRGGGRAPISPQHSILAGPCVGRPGMRGARRLAERPIGGERADDGGQPFMAGWFEEVGPLALPGQESAP